MLNVLNQIGGKLSSWFGEPENGVKGDKTAKNQLFEGHSLAQFLPYEAYDEETGIFLNKDSLGFAIEVFPLVGCEEATQKEVASIFEELLKEGDSIQCLLWADHRINSFLNSWQKSRDRSTDLLREIAHRRAEFFKTHSAISPRRFRFIFSYSTPLTTLGSEVELISSLVEKRERILKILKSFTYAFNWDIQLFLDVAGCLINFSLDKDAKKLKWNCCESLSNQLTRGGTLTVDQNCLNWKTDSEVAFKSFRVIDTPSQWSMGAMQLLIGDILRDNYRIQTPYYFHYGVHCPKQTKLESSFWQRSQLIEKQGRSYSLLRMIPQLEGELKECQQVRKSLSQGARFVWTQFGIGIWAPKERLSSAEQSIKSIFRINEFSIAENTHLHLPQLLASLPMTWAGYVSDLKNLNLIKTTLTTECSNFIPLQGEWMGTVSPGMLLIGRRGQLLNWNPFDNKSGNYNVSFIGRSGSGKSVAMQDLLVNGLGTGAKAFVIDVGRSFEKMCESLSGQAIHFSKESKICLNPFSYISKKDEEARNTSFSFLKSTLSCMAAPNSGTNDHQDGLIEMGIRYAWEQKQNQATITDVVDWMGNHKDPTANMLGVMLTRYSKNGVYGKYFEGDNNVNFNDPLVVIELEELKDKKDLQAVALQVFIMAITDKTFLGDRRTPYYICIDEAWDLLKTKQSGVFIETLARRLRKYYGSLVVGSQSVEEFFSTPGALAAFENSDWLCLLSQKKSSIARLAESGKMALDEYQKQAFESISTRQGEYSEIMICDADGNYSISRLLLDPFSKLLYTTKPQEYAKIQELRAKGLTIPQAINSILGG